MHNHISHTGCIAGGLVAGIGCRMHPGVPENHLHINIIPHNSGNGEKIFRLLLRAIAFHYIYKPVPVICSGIALLQTCMCNNN